MRQRVFVGDVQGCADELDALVARAHAELGGDFELLFTGDLVNRGPESLRVLERVRGLADAGRARTVLGNHDLWLVAVALGVAPADPSDTFGDVLHHPDHASWIEWLRSQPLMIDGAVGATRFALVHASLAPSWELAEAREIAAALSARLAGRPDGPVRRFLAEARLARATRGPALPVPPAAGPARKGSGPSRLVPPGDLDALGRLLYARTATRDGGWSEKIPEEVPGGEPWHAAWTRADHDFGVVYGHWALQRLHVAPRLRGLDTGCVHHGRGRDGFLTAWLPDEGAADPFAIPDTRFWHVLARRRYWP